MTKERINFTITKYSRFCGHSVNYPLVAEADSLPQLEDAMKTLLSRWMQRTNELLFKKEPFEFVQQDFDPYTTADQQTTQLKAENQRLREATQAFMSTIPLDNGNWYLPGFDESLENLKKLL